jgi:hypothetical protein
VSTEDAPSFVFCECKYIDFFQSAKTKTEFFSQGLFYPQQVIPVTDKPADVVKHPRLHFASPGRWQGIAAP